MNIPEGSSQDFAIRFAQFLVFLHDLDPDEIEEEAHILAVVARTFPGLLPALPWAALATKAAEALRQAQSQVPDKGSISLTLNGFLALDCAAVDRAVAVVAKRERKH